MIDNIFGLSIRYEPWDKKSILPLYIVSNYQFYTNLYRKYTLYCDYTDRRTANTSIIQKTNTKKKSSN